MYHRNQCLTGAVVVPEPMATGPSSSTAVAMAVQRPNTKRKRKFKRMAVDPNNSVPASSSAPDASSAMDVIAAANNLALSGGKRPKVRNR